MPSAGIQTPLCAGPPRLSPGGKARLTESPYKGSLGQGSGQGSLRMSMSEVVPVAELVRFGVSMDAELLAAFDHMIERKQYDNRSEALRDLVRDALMRVRWERGNARMAAVLSLVYDHTTRDLPRKLTRLQHRHVASIVSTLHIHLDEENCLEVLVLRGRADDLQDLADKVIATRGVRNGQLMICTPSGPVEEAD